MRTWCIPSFVLALLLVATHPAPALAQDARVVLTSKAPFARVAAALEQAVADQAMGLVCRTNPQHAALTRGVKIPGNQVFLVFRNDFAVRLINADSRAAYEAPIRIYLYENRDGTATLTYVRPSALLRPYAHPDVVRVGVELDPIFEKIVAQALDAK
jgi:uncharacterized protein (DUF302 family)